MLRFKTNLVNYSFTMPTAQRDSGRHVAISCTVCGKHHRQVPRFGSRLAGTL
jgi:hypothetical protein